MGHGYPDWGPTAPIATVYTLQDLAELAARLGSPVVFQRTGNVIFLETFDSLAKVITETGGIGGSISISSEKALYGDFSCKMITGGAVGDYAVVRVRLAYPILSKIGVEFCWHMPDDSSLSDIWLDVLLYDGTTSWWAMVGWYVDDDTWYYFDADGNEVPLSPTVAYFEGQTQFNHTKLVVDFEKKEYVRLVANNLTYNLTGKPLRPVASGLNAQLLTRVVTYARALGGATIFLDSMIVTQNEP